MAQCHMSLAACGSCLKVSVPDLFRMNELTAEQQKANELRERQWKEIMEARHRQVRACLFFVLHEGKGTCRGRVTSPNTHTQMESRPTQAPSPEDTTRERRGEKTSIALSLTHGIHMAYLPWDECR
jgi:hypothetical protein